MLNWKGKDSNNTFIITTQLCTLVQQILEIIYKYLNQKINIFISVSESSTAKHLSAWWGKISESGIVQLI